MVLGFPRQVLLALLIAGFGVLVVEILLTLFGLGKERASVARGFQEGAVYMGADPDRDGGYVTRIFDGRQDEKRIPPKSDKTRVLVFGGSNVQGFPEFKLESFLNDQGDGPGYEVINLGRSGYGSGRVRILVKQSMALNPDIIIVYSGHNEFVEKSFAQDLDDKKITTLNPIVEYASHLRAFNAMVKTISSLDKRRDPQPDAWRWEYEKFADYTYDQTLAQLESYRDNLSAIVQAAKENNVRIYLATVVGNMLSPPFASGADLDPASQKVLDEALRKARDLFPAKFQALIRSDGQSRLSSGDWTRDPSQDEVVAPPQLRPLHGVLAHRNTLMSSSDQWSNRVRPFLDVVSDFHRTCAESGAHQDLNRLKGALGEVFSIVPEHPEGHYLSGLLALLERDPKSARKHLQAAARFDRAPRKSSDATNDIVREVSEEFEVPCIELAHLFMARSPDGIIGWEFMMDECHLHYAASIIVMRDLADVLLKGI